MTSGASKTALQGIYDAAIRNREVRAWKRRQRPSIGLYDGDWTFRARWLASIRRLSIGS